LLIIYWISSLLPQKNPKWSKFFNKQSVGVAHDYFGELLSQVGLTSLSFPVDCFVLVASLGKIAHKKVSIL